MRYRGQAAHTCRVATKESMSETISEAPQDSPRGLAFALGAYFFWGMMPLYMKAVAHIPAAEVVAHRIIWSLPIAAVTLVALGRTHDLRRALRTPKMLAMGALTAAFITANWGVYVWAIAVGRTVEAALGYYINPLISIAMGAILLGERLDRFQIMAMSLAAAAVVLLTVNAGGLPWVSLALGFSFAIYGYLRKTLPIGPSQGFFLEVLILTIPALGYVAWLQAHGENHFTPASWSDLFLLLGCGPVTAVPLLLYGFGAKLLRYSTIGIMQYIVPTLIFLIAVFVFGEPFGGVRAIAFCMIWMALALYTLPMLRKRKARSTVTSVR